MIGWTDEQENTRDERLSLDDWLHAMIGGLTVISGGLVMVSAIFAAGQDAWTRTVAGIIGILTIVCGGLMGRRE